MNILQSDEINSIVPALIAARANFKAAVKDGVNPHFKSAYVTLAGVVDAITDALLAQGIYATQQTSVEDAQTLLHTRFIHKSGQWIGGIYPIHPIKADPQGEGSALTYARRYALMALAGIAPEDDDGNAATAAANKPIDAGQVSTLLDWINSTESDVGKFCAVFGVSTVEELPAGKYEAALAALKKKAAKVAA